MSEQAFNLARRKDYYWVARLMAPLGAYVNGKDASVRSSIYSEFYLLLPAVAKEKLRVCKRPVSRTSVNFSFNSKNRPRIS